MGVGGQQIAGVIDALHEAVGAGFPDDPSTQVGNYFAPNLLDNDNIHKNEV